LFSFSLFFVVKEEAERLQANKQTNKQTNNVPCLSRNSLSGYSHKQTNYAHCLNHNSLSGYNPVNS